MDAVLILGGAALAALAHYNWAQLFEEEGRAAQRRFLAWSCKGLLFPVTFWFIVNCGLVPGMPILVREVALAKSRGGNWMGILLQSSGPALFAASSCWAAATFGWLLAEIAVRTKDRDNFNRECLFWSALLVPVAALVFFLTGPGGLGLALSTWLAPVVHLTLPIAETKRALPMYSRAIAKLKFGKYQDAEAEVLTELEEHEDDFEGWMMLADLYANQFNDLPEADRTIRDLCGQPNISGIQISLALHRLADWHLKLRADPVSARSALEEICARLPDTHFARMARQRIDQLAATREELLEQRKPRTFRLPALGDSLDDADRAGKEQIDMAEAKAEADRCVERLKRNSNDVAAREQFAALLAERLGRSDLALEQLELLLAMPAQPASKCAEWLAMMAVWQIKHRADRARAKTILERLVREFPATPQALAAQRRLDLLETEALAECAAPAQPVPLARIKLV